MLFGLCGNSEWVLGYTLPPALSRDAAARDKVIEIGRGCGPIVDRLRRRPCAAYPVSGRARNIAMNVTLHRES